MTDLVVTAAKVALVDPAQAVTKTLLAEEAITRGQPVYITTSGTWGVADANASGKQQARGIALSSVAAGQPVTACLDGEVAGFTLTSLDYGQHVLLSDTAGKLNDQPGTMEVYVGYVSAMADKDKTKVLYVTAGGYTAYWT